MVANLQQKQADSQQVHKEIETAGPSGCGHNVEDKLKDA
jgi:hypothetical protein